MWGNTCPKTIAITTPMSDPAAEKELEGLKRLAANKACANCGVVAPHGHGAVCMAYATFVCHTCKSAHQSYSHLCKSVSMSFWSKAEVTKLRNGGNAKARSRWLAKLNDERLPQKPSLQQAKDFVRDCYIEKRWYDESAATKKPAKAPTKAPGATQPQQPSPPPRSPCVAAKAISPGRIAAPPTTTTTPPKTTNGVVKTADLLTFDDARDAPAPPPPPPAQSLELFDAFQMPRAEPPVEACSLQRAAPVDPVVSLPQQPVSIAVSSTIASAQSLTPPTMGSIASLDPFASLEIQPQINRVHSLSNNMGYAARPSHPLQPQPWNAHAAQHPQSAPMAFASPHKHPHLARPMPAMTSAPPPAQGLAMRSPAPGAGSAISRMHIY